MVYGADDPEIPDHPFERALLLQNMLIAVAENGTLDNGVYRQLRTEFMDGETRSLIPSFIRTCRDANQIWVYLKTVASGGGSWEARRNHIYESFVPLLDHLEGRNRAPADLAISAALSSFNAEGVHRAWERALQRRNEDPEGAITAARTLLETVCKYILDEAGESYTDDDLPKL